MLRCKLCVYIFLFDFLQLNCFASTTFEEQKGHTRLGHTKQRDNTNDSSGFTLIIFLNLSNYDLPWKVLLYIRPLG